MRKSHVIKGRKNVAYQIDNARLPVIERCTGVDQDARYLIVEGRFCVFQDGVDLVVQGGPRVRQNRRYFVAHRRDHCCVNGR